MLKKSARHKVRKVLVQDLHQVKDFFSDRLWGFWKRNGVSVLAATYNKNLRAHCSIFFKGFKLSEGGSALKLCHFCKDESAFRISVLTCWEIYTFIRLNNNCGIN